MAENKPKTVDGIEQRINADGNISYRVKVRLRGQPSQSATFERRTDAKRWKQQTESAIREGRYFKTHEARKHDVAEVIDRYLKQVKRDKPKRHDDVEPMLKWWSDEIGYCLLSDLSKQLILQKRDKLLSTRKKDDADRSNARVNRIMAALRHALTVATNQWEWLEENPMRKITQLPEPKGRVRFLSNDERKRLLAACQQSKNPYLYLIVTLALSAGPRKGEILNLRWSDVALQRKTIVLYDTKNGDNRLLHLAGLAMELMKKHQESYRKDDNGLVFPSPHDPKRPIDIRSAWEHVLDVAKVEDFKFHDLRHSAASYMIMNGATLAEVAEVLGHKTYEMVKRYSHLSEAHTASVVEAMNEKIFGDVKKAA